MNKPSPTNYLDRLRAKAEERLRAHAEGLKQLGPIARTVSQVVQNESAPLTAAEIAVLRLIQKGATKDGSYAHSELRQYSRSYAEMEYEECLQVLENLKASGEILEVIRHPGKGYATNTYIAREGFVKAIQPNLEKKSKQKTPGEKTELKRNLLVLHELLSAVCLHIKEVTAKL